LSVSSREELEEERRLFYVAVTRARSVLTLSMAKSRFKYGDIQFNEPSRFVEEIDKKYLATVTRLYAENPRTLPKHQIQEVKTLTPLAKMDSNPAQQITATQTATPKAATGTYDIVMDLSIGTKVEHEKFGQGVVEKLEGAGMEVRAIIKFKTKGEKTLILRYAKLKVLG
jgi:DNA helicase-2/ATP-dependent DNA helicase PcrA